MRQHIYHKTELVKQSFGPWVAALGHLAQTRLGSFPNMEKKAGHNGSNVHRARTFFLMERHGGMAKKQNIDNILIELSESHLGM